MPNLLPQHQMWCVNSTSKHFSMHSPRYPSGLLYYPLLD